MPTLEEWLQLSVIALAMLVTLAGSIRIPKEWERMSVLRLGRFHGMKGPGLFFRIPLVDVVSNTIDTRTIVLDIPKQKTMTKDNVPVTVDAVVYYKVEDPQKSVLVIGNYREAIEAAAGSMLRDVIGKRDLDDLLQKREVVGKQLKEILDAMTETWGVDISEVVIRELWIAPELEEAMSREAAAARERRARTQLALAEQEIAKTLVEAAHVYESDPVALNIRSMNMLYEMCMQGKATTIFVPTDTALEMRSPMGAYGVLGGLPKRKPVASESAPE